MRSFPDLSIKTKLNLLLALSAAMALLLAGTAFVAVDVTTIRKSTVQHLSAVADVLGANTVAAITFDDPDAATEVLSSLRLEPNVRFACVYDGNGEPFAIYRRDDLSEPFRPPTVQNDGYAFTSNGTLQIFTTLSDTEDVVGTLYLQAGMEQLYANLKQNAGTAAIVLVVSLGASMLLSSRLQRVVSVPIAALAAAAKRISDEGDYSVRVQKVANDEIGSLCDEFNRMLAEIQINQTQLKKANDELELRVEERTRQLSNTNVELSQEIVTRQGIETELRDREAKFRAIMTSTIDPMVTVDAQGIVQDASNSVEKVFGWKPQELVGSNISLLIPEPHRSKHNEYLRNYLATGESSIVGQQRELEAAHKDGSTFVCELMVWKINLPGQTEPLFTAFIRDVSVKKRAEEELRKLSGAVEHSPTSVVITDAQGTVEYVNPKFTRVTGYTSQEALGENPRILKSDRTPPEVYREMWETITSGREWHGELQNRKKNGELHWESVSISPITNSEGVITHFVALKEDITARKQAEAKHAMLNKRLIDTSRRVGQAEIATSVLHNVGNVLNSVNVSASLVCDKLRKSGVSDLTKAVEVMEQHLDDLACYMTQDERGKHLVPFLIALSRQMATDEEIILQEVQSLVKNIEHVKEIVALQQSHAGVSGLIQEVSLAELLEDAIRINIASVERHGIKVEREFEEFPPVRADRQKLLQVLVNLVSNAKYALIESDHSDRQIVVRLLRADDGLARIEVQDNGIGIPAENMSRIFSHGFTTRQEGHGFGLHSGALAAEEMGATLTAHSDGPQTGATFVLEIPFKTAEVIPCAIETK